MESELHLSPLGLSAQWARRGGVQCNAAPATIEQPERKGFGSIVIERFKAAALGGKVESGFAPEGFTWLLETPAEHLLSEAAIARPASLAREAASGQATGPQ